MLCYKKVRFGERVMSSFNQHCRETVKDYIQTVLIIDDGAGLSPTLSEAEPINVNSILKNKDPLANNIEQNPQKVGMHDHIDDNKKSPKSHPLNTLELTNSFYNQGIIAGIYQPKISQEKPEDFANKVALISSSADIIILDWMLKDNDDRYSQAIVKAILAQDVSSGGRLRTIVIYTGENNLHDLRDRLWKNIGDNSLSKDTEYQISSNNLIIIFYNKIHTVSTLRAVSEEELPNLALSAFATLVDGLLPAFAMKSASEIRRNIGKIISKFPRTLDAGYLTHRSLLLSPEDSEVFILDIFVTYLRSLLAISQTDRLSLGIEVINKWAEKNISRLQSDLEIENSKFKFTIAQVLKILNDDLSNSDENLGLREVLLSLNDESVTPQKTLSKSKVEKIIKNSIDKVFDIYACGSDEKAINSIKDLAILSLFRRTRSDITKETPYLTQGTLIYCLGSEEYFLCMTPKCDTVRLSDTQNFSFAPLTKVNDGTKGYDLIIPNLNNNGYINLKTQNKFYNLRHLPFKPSIEGRVKCLSENGRLLFHSAESTSMKYQWIGDLQDLQAQNRVISIIGDLSRNGVEEMEWLRQQ
jgi:hypothetical protein